MWSCVRLFLFFAIPKCCDIWKVRRRQLNHYKCKNDDFFRCWFIHAIPISPSSMPSVFFFCKTSCKIFSSPSVWYRAVFLPFCDIYFIAYEASIGFRPTCQHITSDMIADFKVIFQARSGFILIFWPFLDNPRLLFFQ